MRVLRLASAVYTCLTATSAAYTFPSVSEKNETVKSTRISQDACSALDQEAEAEGISTSMRMRQILTRALRKRGWNIEDPKVT